MDEWVISIKKGHIWGLCTGLRLIYREGDEQRFGGSEVLL